MKKMEIRPHAGVAKPTLCSTPRRRGRLLAALLCALVVAAGSLLVAWRFVAAPPRVSVITNVPDGSDVVWRSSWAVGAAAGAAELPLGNGVSYSWETRLTGTWTEVTAGQRRGEASVLYLQQRGGAREHGGGGPSWSVTMVQEGRRRVSTLYVGKTTTTMRIRGGNAAALCDRAGSSSSSSGCDVKLRLRPGSSRTVGELSFGGRRWCLAAVMRECPSPFAQQAEGRHARFLPSMVPLAQRCTGAWRLPEWPSVATLPSLPYLWSKGWYNAVGHVASVPYAYYTAATESACAADELRRMVDGVGPHGVVWLRLSSFEPRGGGRDIKRFVEDVLPTITAPFTLITTDGDVSVHAPGYRQRAGHQYHRSVDPALVRALLESDHLVRWYTQNKAGAHPKLTGVPIGLDLHSKSGGALKSFLGLDDVRRRSPRFADRPCCSIYFDGGALEQAGGVARTDRRAALAELAECSLVHVHRGSRVPQLEVWETYGRQRFVVSGEGNGLDCHRTWELLMLGAIPVVRSGPLDELYKGLPVAIVREWRDACNATLLSEWSARLGPLTAGAFRSLTYERFLASLPRAEQRTRRQRLAPLRVSADAAVAAAVALRAAGAGNVSSGSASLRGGGGGGENLLAGFVTIRSHSGLWLSADAGGKLSLASACDGADQRWRLIDRGATLGMLLRSWHGVNLEDREGLVGTHLNEGAYQMWQLLRDPHCGTHALQSHRKQHLGERDVALTLRAEVDRFERWRIELAPPLRQQQRTPAPGAVSSGDGGAAGGELVRIDDARAPSGKLVRDCELNNLAKLLNTKVPWRELNLTTTEGYSHYLALLEPWLLGTPQWAWPRSGVGDVRHGQRPLPALRCDASRFRHAFSGTPRTAALKIIDFVPFGYDIDLLEVRFLELYESVDLFVISECSSTQSGVTKPLFFDLLKTSARFKQFLPKVMHVVFPAGEKETQMLHEMVADARRGGWRLERFFRKYPVMRLGAALRSGGVPQLRGVDVASIVAIQADADEIPTVATMHHVRHCTLLADIRWPIFLPALSGKKTVQWLQTTSSDQKPHDDVLIDQRGDGSKELLAHIWRPGPYLWPLRDMLAANDTLRYERPFDGDRVAAHTGIGSAFHMSSPLEPGLYWLKRGGVIEQSFRGAVSDVITRAGDRAAVTPRMIFDGTAAPWCSDQYTARFVGELSEAARALALHSIPRALRVYRKRFCFHFPALEEGLYGVATRREWGDVCKSAAPPPAY